MGNLQKFVWRCDNSSCYPAKQSTVNDIAGFHPFSNFACFYIVSKNIKRRGKFL